MSCFISSCKMSYRNKRSQSDKDIIYHRFPLYEKKFQEWLIAVGVSKSNLPSVTWHENMYICSLHFTQEDYTDGTQKVLKTTAVPTVFNSSSKQREPEKNIETGKILKPTVNVQTGTPTTVIQNISQSNECQNLGNGTSPMKTHFQDSPEKMQETVANENISDKLNAYHSKYQHHFVDGKYFRPRRLNDIKVSDLSNPRKAKRAMKLMKDILLKETRIIKSLKNDNKVLYDEHETLQSLAKYIKKKDTKSETLTLMVNI